MTALSVYRKLSKTDRAEVRSAALRAAHPTLTRPPAWGDSDCSRESDHPALVATLVKWWQTQPTGVIVEHLDAAEVRAVELAIVLCAESVAYLNNELRVAECRRVRLSWVRGEASDKQRATARVAASAAASSLASNAAQKAACEAASSAASKAVRHAAWDAAWASGLNAAYTTLGAPLRTLYPDPCHFDWRDALTRWDAAVAQAQAAMRAIGGEE